MTRRALLQAAAALPAVAQARRPNLVLFLADDLGFGDVGYNGSNIQTPNIDRLSGEGVRFERFHAFPLCSPSRAALLTGRNPVRYGLVYSVVRPWANYGLSPDEKTMADVFGAAGYQTAATGKWHLGHAHARLLPNARGFNHFYGHMNGAIDYFAHVRDGVPDWQRNGESIKEEGYSTDLIAQEASRWIRARDRSRPFFLYVPWNAPHTPLQAPQHLLEKYSSIPQPRRRAYAAMVDAMDAAMGRVFRTLQQEKIENDTIIVFLSDNGGPRGQGADNGELRAGKATVFEGGLRVPAFVRWPGALSAGTTEQVATVMDLLPTLAAAAGIGITGAKPVDGLNLWPLLRAGQTQSREELFFAVQGDTGPKQHALRSGDWKFVRIEAAGGQAPQEYLFNVVQDPAEKTNRASSEGGRARELRAVLEKWIALHPPAEVIVSQHAHPGWIRPSDWAKAWVK